MNDNILFQGNYDDFSSSWYSNVGTTIVNIYFYFNITNNNIKLSTMVINIFTIPGIQMMEQFVQAIKKCFDRGILYLL